MKIGTILRYIVTAVLGIIVVLLIYSRILYHTIPFERDEGEYAYVGQLILHGLHPYADAYNMKYPGTYFLYAGMMALGGERVETIRWGTIIVLCITAVFIFLTGKKLFKSIPGALLAVVIFLSLNSTMNGEGLMSNCEHFVNLMLAVGLFFLVSFVRERRLFQLLTASFFFGLTVVMKQHGAVYILFGWLVLLFQWVRTFSANRMRHLLIYTAVFVLPLLTICLYFIGLGSFDKFYFLTYSYAKAYISIYTSTWSEIKAMCRVVISAAKQLWLFGAISVAVLLFYIRKKETLLLLTLLIFSLVAVSIGSYYRYHYFILLYVPLCFICSYTVVLLSRKNFATEVSAWFIALTLLISYVFTERDNLFPADPVMKFRKHYQYSCFYDAPSIARYADSFLKAGEKLSMFGNEPEIFFHASRVSSSSYIYVYPLLEQQPYAGQMTKEYIGQIEKSKSSVFLYTDISIDNSQPAFAVIQNWWKEYRKDYSLRGVFCINGRTETFFKRGNEMNADSAWRSLPRIEFWLRDEKKR